MNATNISAIFIAALLFGCTQQKPAPATRTGLGQGNNAKGVNGVIKHEGSGTILSLDGTWQSACEKSEDEKSSSKRQVIISGANYEQRLLQFDGSTCSESTLVLKTIGTSFTVEEGDLGTFIGSSKLHSVLLMLNTQRLVNIQNTEGAHGARNWGIGEFKDVTDSNNDGSVATIKRGAKIPLKIKTENNDVYFSIAVHDAGATEMQSDENFVKYQKQK